MKLNKNLLIAGAIAVLMGSPLAASATEFTFDPTGGTGTAGDVVTANGFDQVAGNAFAQNGVAAIQGRINGAAPFTPATNFTLYYQANLNSVTDVAGDSVFSVSKTVGTPHFTFIAGFGETVLTANNATASASFAFDPSSATNYFRVYATTANGNNLTGTGFTSGMEILSGKIVRAGTSAFSVDAGAPVALDQNGVDNFPGVTTVTGRNATDFTIQVTGFNTSYFTSGLVLGDFIESKFKTNSSDPFDSTDPARCINTVTSSCNTVGGGIQTSGLAGINTINGANGASFLLQADARQTFTDVAVERPVPEPATTAILGLGLAMLAFFGISRKKNQA
jgi:hypothetical protein